MLLSNFTCQKTDQISGQLAKIPEMLNISMCAEYVPGQVIDLLTLFEGLAHIHPVITEDIQQRVFPHSKGLFLFHAENAYHLNEGEFGLIPAWWKVEMNQKAGKPSTAKKPRPQFATYNARLETILEKKSFKDSFLRKHCIVPMRAFYESSYFGAEFAGSRVKIEADRLLLSAGIYSEWLDPSTGELLPSFSVITHDPPKKIFEVGHDRCPIFLTAADALSWLSFKGEGSQAMEFCLMKNQASLLSFQPSLDRKLAAGWEKRAPSKEEIQEVSAKILK